MLRQRPLTCRTMVWDLRLVVALATTLIYHGGLLVSGTFRRTYDAYVHIFFADHYSRSWFDPWEPRWYTGFTVTSYPPGSHQLISLVSRLVGLEAAFVIVQMVALLLLVVGVYRFSRLWVGARAAGNAAILCVVATGVAETVHVFGQLPTILALAFLLNATPWIHRWVAEGGSHNLAIGLVVMSATTAAHHVTTLFGAVFFIGPVMAHAFLTRLRTPLAGESPSRAHRLTRANAVGIVARRLRRVLPSLGRSALIMAGTAATLALVVLPYWMWSRSDPITQIPIPHASRDSFIANPNAGLIFFILLWGILLPFLPALVWRGLRSHVWPLTASMMFMAVLGTGGTTPIPRMLLGGAFEILTLDRFTFWASILALPLAGWLLDDVTQGELSRRIKPRLRTTIVSVGMVLALVSSLLVANLAELRTFQPDSIDPDPLVAFLDKDQHDRWRYLTLGFGDQMAWLSANTTAQTVDGNYHSARRLPELITTPVERLEGAKFRGVPGIGSLQQFLAVPERYHLKFVFSNDQFYDPLLFFSGWHQIERLENGVMVWEREDIPPLPGLASRPEFPTYQRMMWGLLPLAAIAAASLAMGITAHFEIEPTPRPQSAWATRCDTWLASRSFVIDDDHSPRDWHVWREPFAAVLNRIGRVIVLPIAVLVILVAGGTVWKAATATDEPTEVVAAYFEDLDFRRFRESWERLDPTLRSDFDAYLLQLSVEDGLVASYSMLESVETSTMANTGSTAEVSTRLTYTTSLAEYAVDETIMLSYLDGQWWIQPELTDPTIPAETFFRRAGVAYGAQQRRTVTTGTTTYADVLDRPEISIRSARLVERGGRLSLVGEVSNIDVDPADVTITAQLLSDSSDVLASYNATTVMAHKLLPSETTPFRIDFEGVAGAIQVDDPAAGSFNPEFFTPPQLDAGVEGADVYAKAILTGTDLARDLIASDISIHSGVNLSVSGSLFNAGIDIVTIPHVLITLYDLNGDVAWVDHAFVEDAVRPGRTVDFDLQLPVASSIEIAPVTVTRFDNGLVDHQSLHGLPDLITLPDGFGYAGLRIMTTGFTGRNT